MTDILLLDIRNHDEIDSIKYNIDYVEDEDVEDEDNEETEGFKNKNKKKKVKTNEAEGFHNKNLGFGIFTSNIARNILRTALIILFMIMIQDKYVKDAVMKIVKNSNMVSKNVRDAIPLILISLVVFTVVSFL